MNRTALAVALATVVAALTACDTSPGVVMGRHTATLGGTTHYIVEVKHSKSGKTLDEDVSLGVYHACTKGDRWPDCAR